MSIVDEVGKILNEKKPQFFNDPEYIKMHNHYLKMKELGKRLDNPTRRFSGKSIPVDILREQGFVIIFVLGIR